MSQTEKTKLWLLLKALSVAAIHSRTYQTRFIYPTYITEYPLRTRHCVNAQVESQSGPPVPSPHRALPQWSWALLWQGLLMSHAQSIGGLR